MNSVTVPIVLTLAALTVGGVSLTTNYWLVFEYEGFTAKFGLWIMCLSNGTLSHCAKTTFYDAPTFETKLNAVRALMIAAVVATLVALVTGIWLASHRTQTTMAFVAMGFDIFATVCVAVAVGIFADMVHVKSFHASFGLAIADGVIAFAAGLLFFITRDNPNQVHQMNIARF